MEVVENGKVDEDEQDNNKKGRTSTGTRNVRKMRRERIICKLIKKPIIILPVIFTEKCKFRKYE